MAAKFEVYESHGQYRFRLKAANGEIVASGEAYSTKAGAHEGCEAVKRAASEATRGAVKERGTNRQVATAGGRPPPAVATESGRNEG